MRRALLAPVLIVAVVAGVALGRSCGLESRVDEMTRRVRDLEQQQRGLDSDLRWLGRGTEIDYRRDRHREGFLF
jgi:hypothetical protein